MSTGNNGSGDGVKPNVTEMDPKVERRESPATNPPTASGLVRTHLLQEWVRNAGDAFSAAAFHRSRGWYQLTDPFSPYLMAHIPKAVQSRFGWDQQKTWPVHVRIEILLWICTEVETLARELELDLRAMRFETWRTRLPKGGTFREGIEHVRRVAKEQQARTA